MVVMAEFTTYDAKEDETTAHIYQFGPMEAYAADVAGGEVRLNYGSLAAGVDNFEFSEIIMRARGEHRSIEFTFVENDYATFQHPRAEALGMEDVTVIPKRLLIPEYGTMCFEAHVFEDESFQGAKWVLPLKVTECVLGVRRIKLPYVAA